MLRPYKNTAFSREVIPQNHATHDPLNSGREQLEYLAGKLSVKTATGRARLTLTQAHLELQGGTKVEKTASDVFGFDVGRFTFCCLDEPRPDR
jgi:hypothetical protein